MDKNTNIFYNFMLSKMLPSTRDTKTGQFVKASENV